MARIAYVNGRYQSLRQAAVAVEDRGLQFGDSVYEVIYVAHGQLMDAGLHLARLRRSLDALRLPFVFHELSLIAVLTEVVRRNRLCSGLLYIQITRGHAPRAHAFPDGQARPTMIVTARSVTSCPAHAEGWGVFAITLPDDRWARCDIKTTNLLPNVLARQQAREQGAAEAILYDRDGNVTEGAATTVWAVGADGVLRTRNLDYSVLPGCTREILKTDVLPALDGFSVREEPIALHELRTAQEIFLTSATSFVKPVLRLDGLAVGDGTPGPVARHMLHHLSLHFDKQVP
ncbi:D-alanine aminotransferase [Granulibacter bethesdensis]|uniref:aminotransferase class IV n=1 Tax=Granulibacter bethesdensis TaxID=364410 RepID=UPI000909A277|nr:aminotransferase class IV [Granulibacter bethesdensis]APH56943.1 D-alanine aminotransferase [Granulibacter bethesdensis]